MLSQNEKYRKQKKKKQHFVTFFDDYSHLLKTVKLTSGQIY